MADVDGQPGPAAAADPSGTHDRSEGLATGSQPSEDELRAAYEAELGRITSSEMILQTAVSLLNIGGRRLGLGDPAAGERDLEQVRDAIDGVDGLLPILERRMPREIGPLRDAISQLKMAYAREVRSAADTPPSAPQAQQAAKTKPESADGGPTTDDPSAGPGPAESSGRLWVPGR